MEWILICNSNYYDIRNVFSSCRTITWPQIENVTVGDVVYCYATNPYKAVLYKCEVMETNLKHMDDNARDYVKHALFYENKQTYMRLVCKEQYPENVFLDQVLKENGVESLQLTSKVPENLSRVFGAYNSKNQKNKKRKKEPVAGIILLAILMIVGVWYNGFYKKDRMYQHAVEMANKQQYFAATAVFEQLGNYKDSEEKSAICQSIIEDMQKEESYNKAVTLMQEGSYEEAIAQFETIPEYKNAEELRAECEDLKFLVKDSTFEDKWDLAYYFGKTIEELMADHPDIKLAKGMMRAEATNEDIYHFNHQIYIFTKNERIASIVLYKVWTTATSDYALCGNYLGATMEENDKTETGTYRYCTWYTNEKTVMVVATARKDLSDEFNIGYYYPAQVELSMMIGRTKSEFLDIYPAFKYMCTVEGIDIYTFRYDFIGIDPDEDVICWTHIGGSKDYCIRGYYVGMKESERKLSNRFGFGISETISRNSYIIGADAYYNEDYVDIIEEVKEKLAENGTEIL